jgi:uncharacterized protein (TIGR03437 family)
MTTRSFRNSLTPLATPLRGQAPFGRTQAGTIVTHLFRRILSAASLLGLAWLVGLLGPSPALAADYYVSPSGSDSFPGTLSQPFLTIQKAASVMVAGDTAFIRAGTYRETVTPANSGTQYAPITFMPYNGESVTVSGADAIPASSWTLSSGTIYKAPMSWDLGAGANQVFLDGQMMIEAQWPNTTLDISHPTAAQTTGGSYVNGGTGLWTGTITDVNLPSKPSGYWNGATLNICLGSCWIWQSGTITDSSVPQQLTFTFSNQSDSLVPSANNAYFLTGKLSELDAPGEWFRDSGTANLFFWTPLGDNPAQHTVEAKHRTLAFNLSGLSFITIQGITLFAATIRSSPQSQYLVLDGLQCQYIAHVPLPLNQGSYYTGGDAGILLSGTNNVLRNSTIAFSSGTGVFLEGTGQRAFNNVIRDTDYRPTYASPIFTGVSDDGVSQQNRHLIAYNTIYNSARFGIYHSQQFGTGRILHNEIYDIGLQTSDLGCTYTWTTDGMGTEIAYNVCHDNHSGPQGFPGSGIYLDDNTSNFVVHHNVVWNVDHALQLTSGGPHQIYNNTFVGNILGLNMGSQVSGTRIQNDIFTPAVSYFSLATATNNILPPTNPQFIDPATYNFQLQPTSPAIAAGLAIPPYTNGYSGSAPDIGAYDHTKPAWKAGTQNAAYVAAPSYAPTLTPGTIAVATGSVAFDSGASVLVTDGANVDWPAPLVYVVASPPQLAFQVPSAAAPGVAMITITNGNGAVSLSSAPLFAGAPPIVIAASHGSGQSATINTPFAAALQATVTTASGIPVANAEVTFAAPATGAGGTFSSSATVATDSSGVAVAPFFTANAVTGSYTITASASGAGAPAAFNLTNLGQANSGTPAVASGGVVSASAFGEFASAAPGSWIEIYGTNLASDSRSWQASDFTGVDAPIVLDGTSVTIGGQLAFVDYISPTQVNVQVPNVAAGTQPLVVSAGGNKSAPYNLTIQAVDPGLLAPASFKVNGLQYAVAIDGSNYVAPAGAIAGATSAPANPGDVIVLYGVGFGPVNPSIPEGQIAQQQNALPSFGISIGGAPATVLYAGLAPNYVGLYQFNVVVPSIAANNAAPVTFQVGGTAGTQTLYLAVQ